MYVSDILVSQDPMLRGRTYLKKFYPNVEVQVPATWNYKDLLIVVTDSGGGGDRSTVLDDVLLTVEVSHPRIAEASRVIREIVGLLRQWPYDDDGVYWRDVVGRPAFAPDDGTGVPLYVATVALSFRKQQVTVNPI